MFSRRWRAQDPNQYDDLDEVDRRSDVRLLDSLIMTVQLNVRKLLQARRRAAKHGWEDLRRALLKPGDRKQVL